MSYAEIKKAINSDLSTPLNALIGTPNPAVEGTGNLFSYLKKLDTITSMPFIKSIQRGFAGTAMEVNYPSITRTITIAPINTAKSILLISSDTPSVLGAVSVRNNSQAFFLSTTKITQNYSMEFIGDSGLGSSGVLYAAFFWQVIEFY